MPLQVHGRTAQPTPKPKTPEITNLPPKETTPAPVPTQQVGGDIAALVGGITMDLPTPPKKGGSGKDYPVLPDERRELEAIVMQLRRDLDQYEQLEGDIEQAKAQLKDAARPHYFIVNQGKAEKEVPSSIRIESPEGGVLVTFQDRFKDGDAKKVLDIVGPEILRQCFRQQWELAVDGDKIPQDKAQTILDEVKAIFAKHNCADALEFKSKVAPRTGFQKMRHRLLTPEKNLALDKVLPCVPVVKTKGVS